MWWEQQGDSNQKWSLKTGLSGCQLLIKPERRRGCCLAKEVVSWDGIFSGWWCHEDCWDDTARFGMRHELRWCKGRLRGRPPVLKEVLLWVKSYLMALRDTGESFMGKKCQTRWQNLFSHFNKSTATQPSAATAWSVSIQKQRQGLPPAERLGLTASSGHDQHFISNKPF